MERKQEVVLAPPGGGPALTLMLPDERQRQEWMVGLGAVPGLFRCVWGGVRWGGAGRGQV